MKGALTLERAHRVVVEDGRRHRTAGPVGVVQLGGPEVFDQVKAELSRQVLDVSNPREPRRPHAREALDR